MDETERSDAVLVAESRHGNRGAFRLIVERYQTLICSIAYSGTGSLSRSEDVAQETFIAAWSRLGSLREPEKLRGWLCGIVRNCLHRDRREQAREPVRQALDMDHALTTAAPETLPSEQAVSREEEEILWRSLQNIPPLYREPLVLFYRKNHSVEQVAAALDLTEDTVKQRLSRGRKLLQEEVQALVENTLRRTAPGSAFSSVVLTMLPVGPVAATAGIGMGAKGSAVAKSGLLTAWLVPLAPFLGIAAGVGAHWLVIRDGTTDLALRRKRIARVILAWAVYLGVAVGGEWSVFWGARFFGGSDRSNFVALAIFWWLLVAGTLTIQVLFLRRMLARGASADSAASSGFAPLPMRQLTLVAVVVGTHLAMFSWLIVLAWRCGDTTGVWLAALTMLLLATIAIIRGLGCSVEKLGRIAGIHVGVMGGAILLLLNVRLNAWLAAGRGVSTAELAQQLPTWIVPALTLALVVWVTLLVTLIRSKRGLPER